MVGRSLYIAKLLDLTLKKQVLYISWLIEVELSFHFNQSNCPIDILLTTFIRFLSEVLVPCLPLYRQMFVIVAWPGSSHWLLVSSVAILSRLSVSTFKERAIFMAAFRAAVGTCPGNIGYGAHVCCWLSV
ncbi:hypothetical protein FOTG_17006 [Fusarium oxysporum f. sp. vasinfectum 25433]|uniref:Uncharacterized protein n=1 Tax=Fusarium oxysporum f. sp. vasinfectum 25433 TaxID=1089449 RepID=X0L0N2_FUSOX|nr:hypothetical protein FOTG_17006 [Fusarium oxysporum f. sp. vasinfectum 25433]